VCEYGTWAVKTDGGHLEFVMRTHIALVTDPVRSAVLHSREQARSHWTFSGIIIPSARRASTPLNLAPGRSLWDGEGHVKSTPIKFAMVAR